MAASEKHKPSMAEALLGQRQPLIQPSPEDSKQGGAWPSLSTIVGFAFLTFNSAMAVSSWRSSGFFHAVCFAAFSYLDIAMLFYCLRMYQTIPPGSSPLRERLKIAMWLLATLLTITGVLVSKAWGQPRIRPITDFQSDPTCPHQVQCSPMVTCMIPSIKDSCNVV